MRRHVLRFPPETRIYAGRDLAPSQTLPHTVEVMDSDRDHRVRLRFNLHRFN